MYRLKNFSILILVFISFNSLAEELYTNPSMVTIPAGKFIMGSNTRQAPSDGSAWTINCDKRELFFGMIVFADYIIHRGGNYSSSGDWSRIFIRGHTGRSNASSLGEGFRVALDISDDKSKGDSAKLVENTETFLKELVIAQTKFRK